MDELEHIVRRTGTADLVHAAVHDKLTGLPNRSFLRDRIQMAIERKKQNPNRHFALFFLDFDRFKVVNDSPHLGYEGGDELLVAISDRLTKSAWHCGFDSSGKQIDRGAPSAAMVCCS